LKAEWYAPKEIHFTKEQVLWVLQHLEYMAQGYWPSEHLESGYDYLGGPQSGVKRAYFETPTGVASELTARLTACGDDGMLLEFMVASKYDDMIWFEARLARYLHTTSEDIHSRITTALNYCCGSGRKMTSYKDYSASRKWYKKKGSQAVEPDSLSPLVSVKLLIACISTTVLHSPLISLPIA